VVLTLQCSPVVFTCSVHLYWLQQQGAVQRSAACRWLVDIWQEIDTQPTLPADVISSPADERWRRFLKLQTST